MTPSLQVLNSNRENHTTRAWNLPDRHTCFVAAAFCGSSFESAGRSIASLALALSLSLSLSFGPWNALDSAALIGSITHTRHPS